MLNLSLNAVARGPVRIREMVPPEHPLWSEAGLGLQGPVRVDLEGRSVGDGVLLRGTIGARLATECRRCLRPVEVEVEEPVEILYEPLTADEEVELGGEVYPLPERGDQLDLSAALREQVLLRIPDYVVCSEGCRGLCAKCGVDRNVASCDCAPERSEGPWSALKEMKFDRGPSREEG